MTIATQIIETMTKPELQQAIVQSGGDYQAREKVETLRERLMLLRGKDALLDQLRQQEAAPKPVKGLKTPPLTVEQLEAVVAKYPCLKLSVDSEFAVWHLEAKGFIKANAGKWQAMGRKICGTLFMPLRAFKMDAEMLAHGVKIEKPTAA